MPIYEYVCSECRKKFEQLRPASKSGEDSECPTCHSRAERVLSRFCAFSSYGPGLANPVGGASSCASCSSSSCSTCNN
jgi:putative FmdB family regulatory protein